MALTGTRTAGTRTAGTGTAGTGTVPPPRSAGTTTATPEAAGTGSDGTTDDTARWLGGAGLLVGALELGVGIAAVARTRRSRS